MEPRPPRGQALGQAARSKPTRRTQVSKPDVAPIFRPHDGCEFQRKQMWRPGLGRHKLILRSATPNAKTDLRGSSIYFSMPEPHTMYKMSVCQGPIGVMQTGGKLAKIAETHAASGGRGSLAARVADPTCMRAALWRYTVPLVTVSVFSISKCLLIDSA